MISIVRAGHLPVDLVKLVVCAIMFTHGAHRYLYGEIGPLGILGPGEGGWEFSALLMTCFAAVALDYPPCVSAPD